MDREHVKGTADKAKGAIKDTAGKMTGDTKMQAEGKFDKANGAARKVVGDVKDAARDEPLINSNYYGGLAGGRCLAVGGSRNA